MLSLVKRDYRILLELITGAMLAMRPREPNSCLNEDLPPIIATTGSK